jgi:hypothetical protein
MRIYFNCAHSAVLPLFSNLSNQLKRGNLPTQSVKYFKLQQILNFAVKQTKFAQQDIRLMLTPQ